MANVIRRRPDLEESQIEKKFREAWEKMGYDIVLEQEFRVFTNNGTRERRIDFVHLPTKIAVELDGYAYHAGPERFNNDREKMVELIELGWTVMPFSGTKITHELDDCIQKVYTQITRKMSKQQQIQPPITPEREALKKPAITSEPRPAAPVVAPKQQPLPPRPAAPVVAPKQPPLPARPAAPYSAQARPVMGATQNETIPYTVLPPHAPQSLPPANAYSYYSPSYSQSAMPVSPYSYGPPPTLNAWGTPGMQRSQQAWQLPQRRKLGLGWAILCGVVAGILEVVINRSSFYMSHTLGPIPVLIIIVADPLFAGFIASMMTARKWTGTIAGIVLGIMYAVIVSIILHQTALDALLGGLFNLSAATLLSFTGAWLSTLVHTNKRHF